MPLAPHRPKRALIAYDRAGLAHYNVPTAVDLVDTLPRTTTGKC